MESVVGRGTLLAGRYRTLQPLASDLPGASGWEANDQILDRPVRVTVLHSGHVPQALDAARRAALVTDPRLVRVLDVGDHEGVAYIVTEQVTGPSLAELVARGPLPADQARAIVGEASAALEAARRRGVHHLTLRPSVLHLTPDDRVLLTGLAVDGALLGRDGVDATTATRTDTLGLVRLLYAALTGRWPGHVPGIADGPLPHLAAAPVLEGAPVPPAELASGVPNDLDTLCAVTLGVHDDGPQTPAQLVQELEPWGDIRATDLFAGTQVLPAMPSPARPTSPARTPDAPATPARVQRTSVRSVFASGASAVASRPGTPPPAVPSRSSSITGPAIRATGTPAGTSSGTASAAASAAAAASGTAAATASASRGDVVPDDAPTTALPTADEAPPTASGTPAAGPPASAAPAAPATGSDSPTGSRPKRGTRPPHPVPKREAAAEPAATPAPAPRPPAAPTAEDATVALPAVTPAVTSASAPTPTTDAQSGEAPRSAGADLHEPAASGPGPRQGAIPGSDPRPDPREPDPRGPDGGRPEAPGPAASTARPDVPPGLPLGDRTGGLDVAGTREQIAAHRFDPTRFVLLVVALAIVLGLFTAYRALTRPVDLSEDSPDPVPSASAPAESPAAEEPAPEEEPDPEEPAAGPVVASAAQLDPPPDGDENEHPELVPLAIDGDPATAWLTRTYSTPDFGGLKSGVGYALTLAEPATVSTVTLQVLGSGGRVEVRATDPATPTQGEVLAEGALGPETVLTLSEPTETENVVLWFTELPQAADGSNRVELAEVTVS